MSKDGLGKSGERNVILWADHRAEREAEEINKTGEAVLNFVGGVMSVREHEAACGITLISLLQLEMEIPKTLWLKRNMQPDDFEKVFLFE